MREIRPEDSRVDISVLYHNGFDHTRRCIHALRKYTYWPYRLILQDNGSNRNTVGDELITMDNAIFIRNEENLDFMPGNNKFLRDYLDSPYLLLLNNDVFVTDHWLERMMWHFRDPKVGAVGPVSNFVMWKQQVGLMANPNTKVTIPVINKAAQEYYEKHKQQSVLTSLLIGFCFLLRRDVFEKVGFLDERLGTGADDWDWSLRIRELGYKLVIANDVFVYHIGHADYNIMSDREGFNMAPLLEKSTVYMKNKWGAKFDMLFERPRTLSVCCIAKNEGRTLKVSVPPLLEDPEFCDEVIVAVDDSSTDDTWKVASSFGEKVKCYRFTWPDSFSGARNFSLSKATSDWLLWMDADDFFDAHARTTIKMMIGNPQGAHAFAFQTHCLNEKDGLELLNTRIRLFENWRSYRFVHRLHEVVDLRGDGYKVGDVRVWHGGRKFEGCKSKDYQLDFNEHLLMLELEDNPDDPFSIFNMARNTAGKKDFEGSTRLYRRLLGVCDKYDAFTYMACYGIADNYAKTQKWQLALDWGYRCLRVDNTRGEPHFMVGLCHYYLKQFLRAVIEFKAAIELKPRFETLIPTDLGVYTYKSWLNLGSCYFNMGQFEEAEEAYIRALSYVPELAEARNNLEVVRSEKAKLHQLMTQQKQRIMFPKIQKV